MKKEYEEKYPEIKGPKKGYYGSFSFDNYQDDLEMTVGEAITSPTRFFAPVIWKVLEKHREKITGMVHNTGGGQSKSLGLGSEIHYVKNDPIQPDPIFHLIKNESGESWRAMYEDYNMGTGFEIMAKPEVADNIVEIAENFGMGAKIIGECEKREEGNKVSVNTEFGKFEYEE